MKKTEATIEQANCNVGDVSNIPLNDKRLFLIDGYSFVFRAYHIAPKITNPEGVPVGAVFVFANMLFKLKNTIEAHKDDAYVAVIFDAGKDTFRNEIYSEYKANRPDAPEDLKPQFPIVREVAECMNLAVVEQVGVEADDIIATYTKQAVKEGFKVTIISSDKDLMQLVNDHVEMLDTLKDKTISEKEVFEKFGVTPEKVLDVLSLMGDSSDNIPGVPGIGPKTAAELINQFGGLDEIFNNLENIPQKKRREVLEQNKDKAYISRQLATLKCDVNLEKSLEDLKLKKEDEEVIYGFLLKHNFKTLLGRMKSKLGNTSIPEVQQVTAKKDRDYKITDVKSAGELKNFLPEIIDAKKLAYGFHFDKDKNLIGFAIAKSAEEAALIDITDEVSAPHDVSPNLPQTDLFSTPAPAAAKQDALSAYLAVLRPYFDATSIKHVFHGLKDALVTLKKYDLNVQAYDDLEIMGYLLGKNKDRLKTSSLAEDFCELQVADDLGKQVCAAYELNDILLNKIHESKLSYVYEAIEKALIKPLAEIEIHGIKVDKTILKNLSHEFTNRMKQLEAEIFALSGTEFNVGSPKQLGEILFDKLQIPGGKKSKSGAYSTDADTLENLAYQGIEIAVKVLEWRKFQKLVSTYTDSLQNVIKPDTGRIHTRFSNTSTTTGRLSSLDPNLQNIPIRNEEGRMIRSAFIAEDGYKLIDIDFSQIELRLLADMANIDVLKAAFKEGRDIHLATAMEVFGLKESEVTSEIRRSAKTINFGIIYGQSSFGLAKQLGISRTQAKDYIDAYFLKYPGIQKYMEEVKQYARENGFVKTLYGRRVYLPGINDRNPMLRNNAERAAINAPLQGTAADIMKKAMILLDETLKKKNVEARIILQVHDELIIEVKEGDAEEVAKIATHCMENAAHLSVPLTTDAKIGNNWGEVH